jgi:translation elongation factor EF-4
VAQVANFHLAFDSDLVIVPILNKIDLPSAEPQRCLQSIESTFGLPPSDVIMVSDLFPPPYPR